MTAPEPTSAAIGPDDRPHTDPAAPGHMKDDKATSSPEVAFGAMPSRGTPENLVGGSGDESSDAASRPREAGAEPGPMARWGHLIHGPELPRDVFAADIAEGSEPLCPTLVEHVRARSIAVRHALARVCNALMALGLGEDDAGSLELILAEAMNNIVEHAYGTMDGGEGGWIALEVDFLSDWVICRLTDCGKAMPGSIPEPRKATPVDIPRSDLPEGGFGWLLIHELTEHLVYRRWAEINTLTFAMRLQPAG